MHRDAQRSAMREYPPTLDERTPVILNAVECHEDHDGFCLAVANGQRGCVADPVVPFVIGVLCEADERRRGVDPEHVVTKRRESTC